MPKISELDPILGANVDDAADELTITDPSTGLTKRITRAELMKALSVLTMLANNPVIRLDDSDSDNNGEITLDNTALRIEVDEDAAVAGSYLSFRVDATEILRITGDGLRVPAANAPASASDTGAQGEIRWDADYLYVCTAPNTWKRVGIATW